MKLRWQVTVSPLSVGLKLTGSVMITFPKSDVHVL